jgi:CheY-like chemotaxis protein
MDSKPTMVLLVDDNVDTPEMLQLLLQGWDFEVRLASEGEGAQVLTESYDPDIVQQRLRYQLIFCQIF